MLKEAHSPSVCLAQLRDPGNLSCVVQQIDGVSEPSANGITVWTMYVTYMSILAKRSRQKEAVRAALAMQAAACKLSFSFEPLAQLPERKVCGQAELLVLLWSLQDRVQLLRKQRCNRQSTSELRPHAQSSYSVSQRRLSLTSFKGS